MRKKGVCNDWRQNVAEHDIRLIWLSFCKAVTN